MEAKTPLPPHPHGLALRVGLALRTLRVGLGLRVDLLFPTPKHAVFPNENGVDSRLRFIPEDFVFVPKGFVTEDLIPEGVPKVAIGRIGKYPPPVLQLPHAKRRFGAKRRFVT